MPIITITTLDLKTNLPQIRQESMAVKEKSEAEEMEWSAEEQVQLFLALGGLKPIGINKHFYMVCICERLSTALKRDISPDTVWAHLKKLYNLEALDKVVSLPFPQEQRDFSLPEADFGLLMTKKLMEVEEKKHSERETTRCNDINMLSASRIESLILPFSFSTNVNTAAAKQFKTNANSCHFKNCISRSQIEFFIQAIHFQFV